MEKSVPAASPAAYVAALDGWRLKCVRLLRTGARSAKDVDEIIKWGNLVYMSNGPAFMIRAEEERVLFGFWRGARLRNIEPKLKPGGKYEMATMEFRDGALPEPKIVRKLVQAAVALNREVGNPAQSVMSSKKRPKGG